jgi:hypothetical protein
LSPDPQNEDARKPQQNPFGVVHQRDTSLDRVAKLANVPAQIRTPRRVS